MAAKSCAIAASRITQSALAQVGRDRLDLVGVRVDDGIAGVVVLQLSHHVAWPLQRRIRVLGSIMKQARTAGNARFGHDESKNRSVRGAGVACTGVRKSITRGERP